MPYGLADDPARELYKQALKFLTDRQYDQGKTREVPRVTIQATAEGWEISVQDYTLSVKVTAYARYLDEIWAALEAKFLPNATGWKETKSGEGYKRRKAEEERSLAKRRDEMYDLSKGERDPKK